MKSIIKILMCFFITITTPLISIAQIDQEEEILPGFLADEKPNFINCIDVQDDQVVKSSCFHEQFSNEFKEFTIPKELLKVDSLGEFKNPFEWKVLFRYIVNEEGQVSFDLRYGFFVRKCTDEKYNAILKNELIKIFENFSTLIPAKHKGKEVSVVMPGKFYLTIDQDEIEIFIE